ncbi:hypothetical protein SAMN04488540_103222 [Ferrimonas sediminum]|uniref:Uncharacterized protein n=1 Tax=Ferrimonas sediminum TaxID=718193 RepID=A0A1G8NSS2_9GAMM|nr:hypothetical protein [Ferrimonas sediminum]SDI83233.1 hypothetical protein SAMN04488540_103222 [Ferrimonas sediminum]
MAYHPRTIAPGPLMSLRHVSMKTYRVSFDATLPEPGQLCEAMAWITPFVIKKPPFQHAHVGFAILHRGLKRDYLVVCYWANHNECLTQIAVRDRDHPGQWRLADNESFCVWDMQIMAFERDQLVKHILAPAQPKLAGYLGLHLSIDGETSDR